jgi:hypothetical protein
LTGRAIELSLFARLVVAFLLGGIAVISDPVAEADLAHMLEEARGDFNLVCRRILRESEEAATRISEAPTKEKGIALVGREPGPRRVPVNPPEPSLDDLIEEQANEIKEIEAMPLVEDKDKEEDETEEKEEIDEEQTEDEGVEQDCEE